MKYIPHLGNVQRLISSASNERETQQELLVATYELYQLKVSQLRPSSWYSLSALPFLYSLELSSFFQSAPRGRSCRHVFPSGYTLKCGIKKHRGQNSKVLVWMLTDVHKRTIRGKESLVKRTFFVNA